MKKLILLFCLYLVNNAAYSQWQWAKKAGGSASEDPVLTNGLSICYNGAVYVAGVFRGSNFSIGTCTYCPTLATQGGNDMFLSKYDVNGNPKFVIAGWGPFNETPQQVVSVGSATYVIGHFSQSISFLNTAGTTTTLTSSSSTDRNPFIAKFRTADGKCMWATTGWATQHNDRGYTISYSGGAIYVAGDIEEPAGSHGVISKLNTSNGSTIWSAKINNGLRFHKITTDISGNVYAITGPGIGTTQFMNSNNTVFTSAAAGYYLVKYNSSGMISWIKNVCINNNNGVEFTGLGFANGDLYMSGWVAMNPGVVYKFGDCANNTLGTTLTGNGSIVTPFLARYTGGNTIAWVKRIGTNFGNIPDFTYIYSSATDANGNTLVTGFEQSQNLAPNNSMACLTFPTSPGTSVFVAKFNNQGNAIWAREVTDPNTNIGYGVCWDPNGYGYVTGIFKNSLSFNGTVLTTTGLEDVFVGKINSLANAGPDICTESPSFIIGTPPWPGCATDYFWTGPGGWQGFVPQPSVTATGTYTLTATCNGCTETDEVYVFFAPPNGCIMRKAGEPEQASFSIYPNPSSGFINIDITSLKKETLFIKVYDVLGKEWFNQILLPENLASNPAIDLSSLQNGIYIVELIQNNERYIQKVVLSQ